MAMSRFPADGKSGLAVQLALLPGAGAIHMHQHGFLSLFPKAVTGLAETPRILRRFDRLNRDHAAGSARFFPMRKSTITIPESRVI
jgi:hypothetical protein